VERFFSQPIPTDNCQGQPRLLRHIRPYKTHMTPSQRMSKVLAQVSKLSKITDAQSFLKSFDRVPKVPPSSPLFPLCASMSEIVETDPQSKFQSIASKVLIPPCLGFLYSALFYFVLLCSTLFCQVQNLNVTQYFCSSFKSQQC